MPGFVLGPGDGAVYDFHGASVVINASGDDTLGQLAVMESVYPPGLSVHPHVHAGEDEMFYLLSGELVGYCGNENWTATAGTFVFVPATRSTASPSPATRPRGRSSLPARRNSTARSPPAKRDVAPCVIRAARRRHPAALPLITPDTPVLQSVFHG